MQAKYDTSKLLSPELVPGYRLVEKLESATSGQIYSALEIETQTPCRVVVREAEPSRAERFIKEANIAATLFEPGVEDVYESGRIGEDKVFVVSEQVVGLSLRMMLDSDGIPPLLVSIEIIRRAAEALHCLHTKGLTHGAISPENIIVSSDNDGMLVRLQHLDLAGLAQRSIVGNKFAIEAGISSLRYFSPEQTSNEDAGPSTDIYSLGVVFYEMLSGSPPFDAAKASTLIGKHRSEVPADVRIDDFDLRMLVTHALMESLQKRPEARQSTADLFARQLRQIEQLATHVSTPPPILDIPVTEERLTPRKVSATDEYLPEVVPFNVETVPPAHFEDESSVAEHDLVRIPEMRQQIKTAAIPEKREPRKVVIVADEDDIPTLDDAMDQLANEATEGTAYEFANSQEEIQSETISEDFETEEITIVKAPSRITVDWSDPDKAVPAFHTYQKIPAQRLFDVDFFPTLLSDVKKNTYTEPIAKDVLFSSFDPPRRNSLSLRSRIGIASGGLVLFVAFFLFGSNSLGRLVENTSSDDAVVAASTSSAESAGPERQPSVSTPAPKPVAEAVAHTKAPTTGKPTAEVPANKLLTLDPKVRSSIDKNQTGVKASVTPTTLVISAEKGKVQMKSEPTKTPAGSTRPRIVKEPK